MNPTWIMYIATHFSYFQGLEPAQNMGRALAFLTAAYTAVWIVLALYVWILIRRNRALKDRIDELESRFGQYVKKLESGSSGP